MEDCHFVIKCWYQNRKGPSFVVQLGEMGDNFAGIRQDEAKGSIAAIGERGAIDHSIASHTFTVPRDLVISWLKELQDAQIPAVPAITGGFDGANYHVSIRNGESQSHFSWWLDCPEQWRQLGAFWQRVVSLSGT
ncbi:hypothetical protein [Xanthomonas sp. fls2-241-TYG-148]|uniref:hypothetical protein n=1 Tax=Xanthomonas sp. fls2-241-TYG-148 TaxID=3040328 RepID=UPI002556E0BC|nr:hypothetical protein [Xanthomonas sp. fls2-241-TYG-148]